MATSYLEAHLECLGDKLELSFPVLFLKMFNFNLILIYQKTYKNNTMNCSSRFANCYNFPTSALSFYLFIYLYFFPEPFESRLQTGCLFVLNTTAVFPEADDTVLYNHGTMVKIRKLTLKQYWWDTWVTQ